MSVKFFPFGIKHSRIPISVLALAALRTPEVLFPIVRALVVRKAYHYFDNIFEKGKLVPGMISIKITNVCNLRCKMCAQWGEQGYNFGKPTTEIKEIVPLETYKKLVDDVVHIRPFFYIWGGEPFLYPDLMPLMAYLKEKQLLFTVVTNGVRLAEEAEEIVYTGWDALMLSLDGPRDIHNEVRGHPQSFDTLMEGIHTVQEYKRRRGAARPYIIILTTISRDNAAVLDHTLEMATEVGADLVGIYYSWFTTEERGRHHQQIMLNRLGVHASSWTGYVSRFNEIDTAALQESVRRVNSRRWPFIRMFLPDLKIEQIPRYYQEPGNFFGYNKCVAPWLVAELMPNGDVATCRDYPDYVTGNITRENIIDIFNGERYRKFRRTLRKIGMFPICARCCGLMGF